MIYYSQAINTFEYSCKECGGVCCNLNGGILTFSRDQLKKININELFDYIVKINENKYECKHKKQCWFLCDHTCILKEMDRPLECLIYPIVFWKHEEDIFCELIPCPIMKSVSKNEKRTGYTRVNMDTISETILKYNELFNVKDHNFSRSIKCKLGYNSSILNKIETCVSTNTYDMDINALVILFNQICFHPAIICLVDEKIKDIRTKYIEQISYLKNNIKCSLQNYYILLKNYIIKYTLFKYYYPENDDVIISEIDKNILNNTHFSTEKMILLLRYYRSNGTIWHEL